MTAKLVTLIRLTDKIAIQLHLVAESCTTCSCCSRWPVRKLLDTPSYTAEIVPFHINGSVHEKQSQGF
jgi:hypothetical protein